MLIPDVQPIAARRDAGDEDLPCAAGNGVIASLHNEDDRAHLGVDIAENVANAGLAKPDGAARSSLIQSEIESFAMKERKNIVKKWVIVWKLNRGACRDHENVRRESLVFLN